MKTLTLPLLTLLLLVPFITFGQEESKDYYQLHKGGEKFPKLIRYVFLNGSSKKSRKNSIEISFTIGGEIFNYSSQKHTRDTLSITELEKISFSTTKQLKRDEYREHKKRTKQAGIEMPPPPNHYNTKIFVIEKLCDTRAIKYEVDWIYTIY